MTARLTEGLLPRYKLPPRLTDSAKLIPFPFSEKRIKVLASWSNGKRTKASLNHRPMNWQILAMVQEIEGVTPEDLPTRISVLDGDKLVWSYDYDKEEFLFHETDNKPIKWVSRAQRKAISLVLSRDEALRKKWVSLGNRNRCRPRSGS